ncbi:P-loop containing nucleoside triphosphate hydrolase [Cinara cedri]|uniref:P-loop containing nucleoside triphosphate hydrolase n=1 Tax=Cinara cedri TaxID=506608 RepID=A0A5E4N3Z1_9HEMI|nr:P-loop containing nucleoside triphosphate hydrolase [Cinara cedri]
MDFDGRPSSLSWNDAVERLREIREDDLAFVESGLQPERQLVRPTVAELYVRQFVAFRYIVISNELTVCHDSIIQPQIRILIKRMLMCIHGRVLELKQILMDEDKSIYTPVTEELANLKLTYDQFELQIPRCFRDERQLFLNDIDKQIDEIHSQVEIEEEDRVDEQGSSAASSQTSSKETLDSDLNAATFLNHEQQTSLILPQITRQDIRRELAIKFIQKHIRAANDRKIVNELMSANRTRDNIISGKYKNPSQDKAHTAAIQIQRYWRFYRIMKCTKIRTQRKNIVIGMHMSSERPKTDVFVNVEEKTLVKQSEAATKFWKVIKKLQNKLDRYNRHEIIAEIEDELRAYIWTYFEICKRLPTWPNPVPIIFEENDEFGMPPIILSEAILQQLNIPKTYYQSALNQRVPLGGSAIFHTGRWMTIEMVKILATTIIEFEGKPKNEQNELIKNYAIAKNKEKEDSMKERNLIIAMNKKLRARGDFIPEPSDLTEWFTEILYEYDTEWTAYDDLDLQRPREDLIKTEIYASAQVELRAAVDITMKNELTTLQIAYAQDMKVKYKPPKEKSKKTPKGKPNKKKTLSPKMMFEELVKNDMINKSVYSKFDDFKGEVSYCASTLRGEPHMLDPPYGLGDVRQIIKELCVIGLNFPELRTTKQIKFKPSFLIAGPLKSGKTMLINAICTETGSLKIELTPQNISAYCPDNPSIAQFVNNIVTMVEVYQPVVIEVDWADVPFYVTKHIPNQLKSFKPKLLKTVLVKLLKSLKSSERVIIIGKAMCPWLTVGQTLSSVFDTVVFTVPDYNTMFMSLQESLMRYPAISRTFPVTALATILSSYSRQMVIDIVDEVMNNERVLTLRQKPLEPKEFIPYMIKYPKNPELRDQFYNWYIRFVPLGIERTLLLAVLESKRKK